MQVLSSSGKEIAKIVDFELSIPSSIMQNERIHKTRKRIRNSSKTTKAPMTSSIATIMKNGPKIDDKKAFDEFISKGVKNFYEMKNRRNGYL